MDRKGIISIALAVLAMAVWHFKFEPKFTPPPSPAAAAGSPSPTASTNTSPAGPTSISSAPTAAATSGSVASIAAPTPTPEENVPEKLQEVTGPSARYEFTNLGGGIASASLLNYPAESGSDVQVNQYGTMPIGAISQKPGEGGKEPYQVTVQGQSIVCERTQPDGLVITKKFNLPAAVSEAGGYRVTMEVSFANKGAKAVQSAGYYVYAGAAAPVHARDLAMYTNFDWYRAGKMNPINVTWFDAKKIPLLGIETHPAQSLFTQQADQVGWAGVNSQFFTSVIAPENGGTGVGVWAKRFEVPQPDGGKFLGIEGALQMAAFNLQPGQTANQTFEIYAGPKIYSVLKSLNNGQESILNFGMFAPVSVVLLRSMNWLHGIVGSYAIAIIILTLCIRGALWPIQNRATASMRQMQALQPRMAELKEKYSSDPARMNQEVMKLYKEYKVNPLSGCLPMVIQLPIFFGFYRMLGTAIELRNSRFLWVHDLSQPDTVAHLAGYPVNILPLCMAATMIVQMTLTPKTGDQSQQKMMMFLPLIFVVFCYNFASALALYYTLQNVFSIAQLYVTRAKTAPEPLKPKALPKKKTMSADPKEILDTMLGYLGFVTEIDVEDRDGLTLLQVHSPEKDRLIGHHGQTLEDVQFLLNRILQAQTKDAGESTRVQVDIEYYREMREDGLVQRARQIAELVRKTGRPFHLDPMNSYDRRVIHNAFKDDPDVMTWSPPDEGRIKRITLKRRSDPQ